MSQHYALLKTLTASPVLYKQNQPLMVHRAFYCDPTCHLGSLSYASSITLTLATNIHILSSHKKEFMASTASCA